MAFDFISDFFRGIGIIQSPVAVPTTPVVQVTTGPLAPAFDRSKAPQQKQIQKHVDKAEMLARMFKACLMEVAFAGIETEPTFYGYGSNKPMTASIALPRDGKLDLTVCMNVSGHDLKDLPNKDQALRDRAKDNRYVIQVTHPDGHVDTMNGIEAKGALFTAQDITVKGVKPGLLVVEAWPEHSAGVGGYIEGRRLEITVRGAVDSFGGW